MRISDWSSDVCSSDLKDDLARWCADQSLKLARAGFDTEDVDRNQVVRVAWYRRYVDVGVARVSGRHSIFHGCGSASEERGDGTKCDFYSSFGRCWIDESQSIGQQRDSGIQHEIGKASGRERVGHHD